MKFRYLAAVSLIAISVSGCTTTDNGVMPGDSAIDSPKDAPLRADVNADYKVGSIDFKTAPAPSLDDVLAKKIVKPKKDDDDKGSADKLRLPAMQETALAYGTRAGLAYETQRINKRLQANADLMTSDYNFQRLMIQGQDGAMIMPPIIVEAKDAWEAFDAGKTLRVADTVYEIVEPARFTSVAPMWQTYAIGHFDDPEKPPEALQPANEAELDHWNKWIRVGFAKGQEQAHDILKANLLRLQRDFNGMVRYRDLLEEKQVSSPVVAGTKFGTTGTGQDMRKGDGLYRITQDATLQVDTKGWDASATTLAPNGDPVGPPKPSVPVAAPAPAPVTHAGAHRTVHHPVRPKPPEPVKAAVPAPEKTTGGTGRF